MPYKAPERKRQWEREDREQRNARRKLQRFNCAVGTPERCKASIRHMLIFARRSCVYKGGASMGGFESLGRPQTATLKTRIRIQKAIETMKARGVKDDYCPRCSIFDWNVDLLDLPANSAMSRQPIAGAYMQRPVWEQATGALSVLSIVCRNCGYTIFHTLNVLENPKER